MPSAIHNLIEKMRRTSDCVVHPPSGPPDVRTGHVLPEDLCEFYALCDGFTWSLRIADLLHDEFTLLPARQVVLANPVVMATPEAELLKMCAEHRDISWDWYVIARDGNGDYMSIDLHPRRLGRCYDSFHETHANPGLTAILGFSFSQFLERIIAHIESTRTTNWNWVAGGLGTMSLGDAYDDGAK